MKVLDLALGLSEKVGPLARNLAGGRGSYGRDEKRQASEVKRPPRSPRCPPDIV